MSTPGLFLAGTLVTLILVAAVALLIYAAILDGREQAARRAEQPAPVYEIASPREGVAGAAVAAAYPRPREGIHKL